MSAKPELVGPDDSYRTPSAYGIVRAGASTPSGTVPLRPRFNEGQGWTIRRLRESLRTPSAASVIVCFPRTQFNAGHFQQTQLPSTPLGIHFPKVCQSALGLFC